MCDGWTSRYVNCGDIFCAIVINEKRYALNCFFCNSIFVHLDEFAFHIETKHENELINRINSADIDKDDDEMALEENTEVIDSIQIEKLELDVAGNSAVDNDESDDNCLLVETIDEDHLIEITEPTATNISEDEGEESRNSCIEDSQDVEENSLDCNGDYGDISEDANDGVEDHDEAVVDNNDAISDFVEEEDEETEEYEDMKIHFSPKKENKRLTLLFITEYKKEKLLWDKTNPYYNSTNQRRIAQQRILKTLSESLKLKLTLKDIHNLIRTMRTEYQRAKRAIERAKTKGETYPHPWFYKRLKFMENIRKEYIPPQRNETTTVKLTNEQCSNFIRIYKTFPALWDVDHIEYRFKEQREVYLSEFLELFKTANNVDLSLEKLQKEIKRLHTICTEEKESKILCKRNNEEFQPKHELYAELTFLEDNVPPYPCSVCEKTIYFIDKFRLHKAEHDGSKPFICPICNNGFADSGNFKVHLRRHRGDHPFGCKYCGKRFATTTEQLGHIRAHTGEKPYFCEICGQSFRTCSRLTTHKRRHENKSFNCTHCTKSFYENSKLQAHMKQHLNIKDIICEQCGKAYTTRRQMRRHEILVHGQKRKHICDICGKAFGSYTYLFSHMKYHDDVSCENLIMEDYESMNSES